MSGGDRRRKEHAAGLGALGLWPVGVWPPAPSPRSRGSIGLCGIGALEAPPKAGSGRGIWRPLPLAVGVAAGPRCPCVRLGDQGCRLATRCQGFLRWSLVLRAAGAGAGAGAAGPTLPRGAESGRARPILGLARVEAAAGSLRRRTPCPPPPRHLRRPPSTLPPHRPSQPGPGLRRGCLTQAGQLQCHLAGLLPLWPRGTPQRSPAGF